MNPRLAILLAVPVITGAPARGSDDASRDLAVSTLRAFAAGREKLTSGEFRCEGHLDRSRDPDSPIQGPLAVHCVFDNVADSVLFEQSLIESERQGKVRPVRYASLRSPGVALQWREGEHRAYTRDPKQPFEVGAMPFDPRLVGAITWGTWNGGLRLPPYVKHVLAGAELTAEVAVDGTHHVTWVTGSNRNTKQEFWFDPTRDYVPVRYAVVTRSHANAEWKQPLEQGETTWRKVNGIWVPATTEHNEPRSKHPRRRSYTFEWLSVNQALPPETFDLQSVPLPPGVEVFDHYKPRQNTRQRNGDRERRPPPATQSSTKDAPSLWSPQIAVTGLLAFVLVALLFTTRRSS